MKKCFNEKFGGTKIDGYILIYVFILLYSIKTNESLTSTSCHTNEDLQCAVHHLVCPNGTRVSINDATYGYKIECDSPDAVANCSSATISQCCVESVTDCGSSISFEVLEELKAACLDQSICDVPGLGIQRSCSRGTSVKLNYNSYSKIDYSCESRSPPDGNENGPSIEASSSYKSQSPVPNSHMDGVTSSIPVWFLSPTPTETPVVSSRVLATSSATWTTEPWILSPTIETDILSSSSFQLTSPCSSSLVTESRPLVVVPTLPNDNVQTLATEETPKVIKTSEPCSDNPSILLDNSVTDPSFTYTADVNSIQIENRLKDNISSLRSMFETTEDSPLLDTILESSKFPKSSRTAPLSHVISSSSQIDFSTSSTDFMSSLSQLVSDTPPQSTALIHSTPTAHVDVKQDDTGKPMDNSYQQKSDDTVLWIIIGVVVAVCIIPSLVVVLLLLLRRKRVKYVVKSKTRKQQTSADYAGKITDSSYEEEEYSMDKRNSTSLLASKTISNPTYAGSSNNPDDHDIGVYTTIDDVYSTYIQTIHE